MAFQNCFYIKASADTLLSLTTVSEMFKYSIDEGASWNIIDGSGILDVIGGVKYYFKGEEVPSIYNGMEDVVYGQDNWFGLNDTMMGVDFELGGSLQSLIYDGDGDNFTPKNATSEDYEFYCFAGAFAANAANGALDISNMIFSPYLTARYYSNLFRGQKTLTNANITLPARSIYPYAYEGMFADTGVNNIDITFSDLGISFTEMGAFREMFCDCLDLTSVPESFFPTIASMGDFTYERCFTSCENLNEIHCPWKQWPSVTVTEDWVYNVAEVGTFYCPQELPREFYPDYRIPSGWRAVSPVEKKKGSITFFAKYKAPLADKNSEE